MINATIEKFGYPETLVAEFGYWVVMLRPQAVTLGSLILAAKSEATAYGELPPEAFVEQRLVIRRVELASRACFACEKMNYLMLMMVDPHVHYHALPRYSGHQEFGGSTFTDTGWPGMPDLGSARTLSSAEVTGMVRRLRECGLEPGRDQRG